MGGSVKDFDLSDVPDSAVVTAAKDGVGVLGFLGKKIAVNVVTKVLLAIPEKEYKRIVAENNLQRAYGNFLTIMDAIAKERRSTCRPSELSDICPMAFTIAQYYQPGRTTDGTAGMHLYTVIGDDGEVIQIQAYDLMQRINITVIHKNGKTLSEDVSPKDAMMLMRFLAGLSNKP